jgi:hypothetical protein
MCTALSATFQNIICLGTSYVYCAVFVKPPSESSLINVHVIKTGIDRVYWISIYDTGGSLKIAGSFYDKRSP